MPSPSYYNNRFFEDNEDDDNNYEIRSPPLINNNYDDDDLLLEEENRRLEEEEEEEEEDEEEFVIPTFFYLFPECTFDSSDDSLKAKALRLLYNLQAQYSRTSWNNDKLIGLVQKTPRELEQLLAFLQRRRDVGGEGDRALNRALRKTIQDAQYIVDIADVDEADLPLE